MRRLFHTLNLGKSRALQGGITLVEVLVSLSILAGVIASVFSLISQNARFMAETEDRLLASVLVENLMVEEFANQTRPTLGSTEDRVEVGGRSFIYRRTAQSGNAGLLQIDLEIRKEGQDQTLARLSAVRPQQ